MRARVVASAVIFWMAAHTGFAAWPRQAVDAAFDQRPTVQRGGLWPVRIVTVPAGADLQAALNQAQPGDTLALEAGATFKGPFHLPRKDGDRWIVIQSSAIGKLPSAGTRVTPSAASHMPKLTASADSVLTTDAGAHHYRFIGIEVLPAPNTFSYNLVDLGTNSRTLNEVPHHLIFERCYIHGDPAKGGRRGIALNSANTSVIDSYISDFKEVGADSQAILGWSGPGPFSIINNYLEGSGENVMFGGAIPSIDGLVPSDIEIRRNHMAKPLTWRIGDPQYAGTAWTVKNLFELKNARRVIVDGNLFEYNWPHAQNGFSILFTVRGEDGKASWATVEDVTFSNNIVRHIAAGVNILGHDDLGSSAPAHRIQIRNNLFDDVGGSWGFGRLFQLLNGADEITFDHNTGIQTDSFLFGGDTTPHHGVVFQNNIVPHNTYGVIGSGTGVGLPSLDRYFPGVNFRRNVIAGGSSSSYPGDNFFPGSLDVVGFVDLKNRNYRLAASSAFKGKASDGKDPGVDVDAVDKAMNATTARVAGPNPGPESLTVRAASAAPVTVRLPPSVRPTPAVRAVYWSALALLAYVYLGYAATMALAAALERRVLRRRPIRPLVSVVIVAYNEASRIAARLQNLLDQDYAKERLEIIVASDGSTDDTVARASAFAPAVRAVSFPSRRGKAAVFNDVIPSVNGDIVIFADARQEFDTGAVTALVEGFGDPTVGAVSGELILRHEPVNPDAAEGAAIYWSYEKLIRWFESRADSTVGATGAIYAIRHELFEPIPADTILDDVVIPMRIVRQGYRVIFEPRARAYDWVTPTNHDEFLRKVRTIAGNFQFFARERWVLHPVRNRLWIQTVSHKALRLGLPLLYAVLFAANAMLLADSFYVWTMTLQAAFYGSALVGGLSPNARKRLPPLILPYTICFLSWATLVGFLRYIRGQQRVTWERPSWTRAAS